ncbi:MAG: ATP-binding protein [bacterium]
MAPKLNINKSIKKKFYFQLVIVLAVVFALFALAIFVISQVVIKPVFNKAEKQELDTRMYVLDNAIDTDKEKLQGQLFDWGHWDETYNYVLGQNPSFISTSGMESILTNLKLDYVAILNTQGDIVHLRAFNKKGEETDTDISPELKDQVKRIAQDFKESKPSITSTMDTFFPYKSEAMLATIGNVIKSDKTGPSVGYMLNGVLFNDKKIESLSKRTGLNIKINEYEKFNKENPGLIDSIKKDKNYYIYANNDKAYGYRLLSSENGNPLSVITVSFDRNVNKLVLKSQNYYLIEIYIAAFLAVVLAILMLNLFMNRVIVNPLKSILVAINSYRRGTLKDRITITSRDELGELGVALNQMIDEVEVLNNALEKKVEEKTQELEREVLETEGKNQLLEQSKVAMTNVLQDVEQERDKTISLAKDLKKFQLAVENASDHIIITNPDGIILYANKGVNKITGFDVAEVINKKAGTKELWGGLMDQEFYQKLWQKIKIEKRPFEGEFKNKRKDGDEYEVAASITPILDEFDNVIFFVAIERDITKAKSIDRAKTEFVSLASHQLRTPLSAINWYTEMLIKGDAGPINKEQEDYLGEIARGNKRMVDLVNSLLNTSRLELGTFEINPEPTDLKQIAQEEIVEMKQVILDKKLKIVEDYDITSKISVDPRLLRIFFQNLISNAVKYTPENGKITIEIKLEDPNVRITVADTGYGIPNDQQDKVFSKLFRADNIRALDTEGTGLGLYIIKSILDASGGQIDFTSKENEGTTFNILIPLTGMKEKSGSKKLE